jgi:hypothetical protein
MALKSAGLTDVSWDVLMGIARALRMGESKASKMVPSMAPK